MRLGKIDLAVLWVGLFGVLACDGGVDEGDKEVKLGDICRVEVSFSVGSEEFSGDFGAQDRAFGVEDQTPKTKDQAPSEAAYSIMNPGVDTDEGTSGGYVPRDVWVIQFGGTGDQAPLVGLPRYAELSGATSIQAVASATTSTLIFVANTHDANIEWGDISTLSKMKLACKKITQESDCYGNNLHPANDLIMSGQYTGTITSRAISAELFRAIARIDFRLINAPGSTMTLQSIQLCNVPQGLCYAAGITPSSAIHPTLQDHFNYPQEALQEASTAGGEQQFTFYTPVNQQGTVAISTSAKTKTTHAPSYATYIRITATDPQNQAYTYKIYPGANSINDYNLRPNSRYTLALRISAPGDPSTDSRVESYAPVDLASSNSFILNPSPQGTLRRTFTFPIDKVNEFWPTQDNTLTISETDTWTAELIWQDAATTDLVRFLDPISGLYTATTFTGTGAAQKIALSIKSGAQGNALIGIKKTGYQDVGYIWSWHLWITDYNPYHKSPPIPGKYSYAVNGGHLHRHAGAQWLAPNGLYSNTYIMDRNLGARHAGYSTVGALFYQFGRKDPMPYIDFGNVLYDINGIALSTSDPRNATRMNKRAYKGVTLAMGVLNPTFFYYKPADDGYGDWTSQGLPMSHIWNHPIAGSTLKSIYDPCPTGWKMTRTNAYTDLVYNSGNPLASSVLNSRRDPRLGWNYEGSPGIRYWPRDSPIDGSILYPGIGYRSNASGGISSNSSAIVCWMANSSSNTSGNYVYSRSANTDFAFTTTGGDARAYGFSARCMTE